MLETIAKYVLLIVGAYLLGGVLFAKLLSKRKNKTEDVTSEGSGNPGTMNMLRNHGIIFGVITLLLDALKGVLPALCGYLMFGGADGGVVARMAIYIGGFFAVLGHIYPVYYDFKGGKGVATSIGFAFVAHPIIGLILLGVYIVLFLITKIGSLSSLICVAAYIVVDTVLLIIERNFLGLILLYMIGVLIFVAHRSNIKRLANKNENVIDLKAVTQKDADLINNIKQKRNEKANTKKKKQQTENTVQQSETTEVEKEESGKVESEVVKESKVKEEKPKTTTRKTATKKSSSTKTKKEN